MPSEAPFRISMNYSDSNLITCSATKGAGGLRRRVTYMDISDPNELEEREDLTDSDDEMEPLDYPKNRHQIGRADSFGLIKDMITSNPSKGTFAMADRRGMDSFMANSLNKVMQ